jgi:hypothetical protein
VRMENYIHHILKSYWKYLTHRLPHLIRLIAEIMRLIIFIFQILSKISLLIFRIKRLKLPIDVLRNEYCDRMIRISYPLIYGI